MAVLKPIKVKQDVAEAIMENGDQPLSPMARMFHEPDFNIYIIVMLGCKTKIDPEVVKANLEHTLLKHPRFTSLQVVDETVEGGLKWVPTKVDLGKHVIVPKLDTHNIKNPDKFVEDYVSNLSKTSINMSIPMWDLHLLNMKTSDAEAVGVFRIHHSLGDGTSLMSLLLASTRKVSNPEEVPTLPPMTKRADNSAGACSGGFRGCLFKIWLRFVLLRNTFVDVVMFLATVFGFLKDTETPLKGRNGCGSNSRRFVHRTVDLNDVKLVKNAMDMTINDVLLGITQAGLSQYLNRKYGESTIDKGASERKNNLPKHIRLRATFFINIRPIPGIQEVADMMKKGYLARWGNDIGFVFFPFKIALRDDPLDYLRDAKAAIDRKKSSLEVYCSFYMVKYFRKFCGMKLAKFPSQTTLCFSNVPGPCEEISYYGHPAAYIAPSCYGQPNGLVIHVVSYVDKLTFILSVDEGTVSDPHQLCDDLEESLNLIKKAIIAKGLVKEDAITKKISS